ncbi:MAG: OmpA family protein [Acidobacteriaceae bacterium]|nr:OmpA family protein [Acidobacteriaceae bacterium]
MKRTASLLLLMTAGLTAAQAQKANGSPTPWVPRATVALGYSVLDANAPPGNSEGFFANGGFLSASVSVNNWLSLVGEFNGVHAKQIGNLGQNLTLLEYAGGPRATLRQSRFSEFGQVTVGGVHAMDSYFPTATSYTTSANSFAVTMGGGMDYELTRRFALRPFEVQYLHTALPNAVNGSQNQVLLGAGLVIKFGGHFGRLGGQTVVTPKRRLAITCSANLRNVQAGETVEVTAITHTDDGNDAELVWTSNLGTISKNSNAVSVDTTGLAPGVYHVTAHAQLLTDNSVNAICEVPFRVMEAPKAAPAPVPPPPPPATDAERDFHEHVQDVYFDYDKWDLKPEASTSIAMAASYLKEHPKMSVLIGGYSDERGSTEYNIALGVKRANAVRDALIQAGIEDERVEVVSYGKGVQVCTTPKETCYHRNRRAAFQMHR